MRPSRFGAVSGSWRVEGRHCHERQDGERPLKAIRHLPAGGTSGWYIWGGDAEPSEQGVDFFEALHVAHLDELAPEIVPYLALPPGYGVIVDAGYEDVWFDAGYVVE